MRWLSEHLSKEKTGKRGKRKKRERMNFFKGAAKEKMAFYEQAKMPR